MPYLRVQTNVQLNKKTTQNLMERLSSTVAESLEKSERFVMIAVEPGTPMLFAHDNAPAAYLELKSIGLPETETSRLSHAICVVLSNELTIPQERVYIEFKDAPRHMWGWNGGTF